MLMPAGYEEQSGPPVGVSPTGYSSEFGPCLGYADRLSLLPDERRALLEGASQWEAHDGDGLRGAMAALHRGLSSASDHPDNAAYPSIQRRLELAYARQDAPAPEIVKDAFGRERLVTSPPVARTSMAARRWPRGLLGRLLRRAPVSRRSDEAAPSAPNAEPLSDSPDPVGRWHGAAAFRRIVIAGLVVSQTYIAANFMSAVLPYHGTRAARDRDPRSVRDPVRLGVGGLLDRDGGLRCCCCAAATATRSRAARRATRRSTADARAAIVMPICNENVAARVRRPCARPTNRSRAPASSQHFDFFVLSRQRRSRHPRRRSRRVELDMCRAVGRLRPRVLPLAPASHQAQERQHRRLLPALGQQLPLHGRARRRQRDERRLPDDAGAADRGESRRRHHPDRAARSRPRHAATRACSSSRRASTARCSPPACTSGSSANRTTGATTRSSASRRSCATARWRRLPGRGRAVGRDPVARLRRGRADAPRRLGGVDRLRPRRAATRKCRPT